MSSLLYGAESKKRHALPYFVKSSLGHPATISSQSKEETCEPILFEVLFSMLIFSWNLKFDDFSPKDFLEKFISLVPTSSTRLYLLPKKTTEHFP
jgi:hypothetical protein